MKLKKIVPWLIALAAVAVISFLLYKGATKKLPGEAVSQLGRDHVTDIAGINYNSNPPTSGSHFAVWAKKGVYDRLISDGYFIHSMEHGYVIIWYDCTKPLSGKSIVPSIYAHDEPAKESSDSGQLLKHMKIQPTSAMSWFTPENQPEIEVPLPESFSSDSCKDLVGKLSEFTKVAQRVIVAPRVGMDTPIALTAWGRILKLGNIDNRVITDFIKTFQNKGPEQTTE